MSTWHMWTQLDNDIQPGKGKREAASKRPASTNRKKLTDGTMLSRENSFRRYLAEVPERGMDPAAMRRAHVYQVMEDVANGRYHVASSVLAECLLNIAHRGFR